MKKLIILIIPILLLCGCTVRIGYDYYEYEDLQGNKGTANDCWSTYGKLICELEDEAKILVQSYKGIYKD